MKKMGKGGKLDSVLRNHSSRQLVTKRLKRI